MLAQTKMAGGQSHSTREIQTAIKVPTRDVVSFIFIVIGI